MNKLFICVYFELFTVIHTTCLRYPKLCHNASSWYHIWQRYNPLNPTLPSPRPSPHPYQVLLDLQSRWFLHTTKTAHSPPNIPAVMSSWPSESNTPHLLFLQMQLSQSRTPHLLLLLMLLLHMLFLQMKLPRSPWWLRRLNNSSSASWCIGDNWCVGVFELRYGG